MLNLTVLCVYISYIKRSDMFHPHILINCELSAVEMPGRTHSYEGRLPKSVEYGVCFAITGYVPRVE